MKQAVKHHMASDPASLFYSYVNENLHNKEDIIASRTKILTSPITQEIRLPETMFMYSIRKNFIRRVFHALRRYGYTGCDTRLVELGEYIVITVTYM